MDLDALKVLLAVAEQESFTRAATKLGMRQSALSRQVQRLEQTFGTLLFYRNGRGAKLTEAGEKVQHVARDIFQSLERVREDLLSGADTFRGTVTLGLPPSLGASLSGGLVRRFRERFPHARLKIAVAFSGALLEWLEAGRVDVGVLYDARRSDTLISTPLLLEDLHLIEKPIGAEIREDAQLSELGIGPFALSCSANGMRRIVDAAAASVNIRMSVTAELDSLDALKEMAETGPERCILPLGAVHRDVKAGHLSSRRFADPQMQALLVLTTPLHQPVTKLASAVIRLVEEEVGRCVGDGVLSGLAGSDLKEAILRRSGDPSPAEAGIRPDATSPSTDI
jgi:LysR family nitrogen assimilation transcriptional regulator